MADADDEAARRKARLAAKKEKIAQLRNKRRSLISSSEEPQATDIGTPAAPRQPSTGSETPEVRRAGSALPETPQPQAPTATPNVGDGVIRPSKLQEKLARLTAIKRSRLFSPSGTTRIASTPSAGETDDSTEAPLREARTALSTAHEEIARLREALAARDSELAQLKSVPQDIPGADEPSAFESEAHETSTTEPEPEQRVPVQRAAGASDINLLLQDEMFMDYLVSLCESGADLEQISETQRAQEEAMTEYENLLTAALEENRELTNRLAHAQNAQQQLDEQLNRYEEENLELLDELEAVHDTAARAAAGSPHVQHAEASERADEVAHLTAVAQKQEEELTSLRASTEAYQKALSAKTNALNEREARDGDRERYIEELEEHVAVVEKERDDAHASIQQLVTEAGEVEEALHSQLELAQHEIESKAQRHAVTERELAALVSALTEERDQLTQQLEEQHVALKSSARRLSSSVPEEAESLAASIAEAENRCPDCLVWRQKHTREVNKVQQVTAKVERLEKDILQERAATDQVVAKWTAHVKSFMAEREEWEKSSKPVESEPEPTPEEVASPIQEAKSRRGLRWTRFLGRSTTKTSPTREGKGSVLFRNSRTSAAPTPKTTPATGTDPKSGRSAKESTARPTRQSGGPSQTPTRTAKGTPVKNGTPTPRNGAQSTPRRGTQTPARSTMHAVNSTTPRSSNGKGREQTPDRSTPAKKVDNRRASSARRTSNATTANNK